MTIFVAVGCLKLVPYEILPPRFKGWECFCSPPISSPFFIIVLAFPSQYYFTCTEAEQEYGEANGCLFQPPVIRTAAQPIMCKNAVINEVHVISVV